ncbi:MAG: endolytic transglycosylase MltG [Flavipsychrobacter sp.]|nr:endolytic transglycosylase MltG [Flavipsychrobacter sp.]
MKTRRRIYIVLLSLTVLALLALSQLFGNNSTRISQYLYIPTGSNYDTVKAILEREEMLVTYTSFDIVARMAGYPDKVKPGKYKIPTGMSNYRLVRMLRSGSQEPVKLVINKLRTKQDFANFVATNLEVKADSILYLLNDTVFTKAFDADTITAMCLIVPDTYEFYWNATADKVLNKIAANYTRFWNEERKQKAAAKNLTPLQIITIASIVEEETNMNDEKGNIASVYINRYKIGMPLQADPTVKFAIGDFTIKRITGTHLQIASPYNTYKNNGLPPGPICTPSKKTIDAVLNAPETKYLYFCAKEDFSGYHSFATNLAEHQRNARAYQQALNTRGIH